MDLTIFQISALVYVYLVTLVESGEYKGCFEENKRRRYMDVNPGDFNPNQLTTSMCAAKCGLFGYQYAGLTSGNFCFCSHSVPPPETLRADSDCSTPCTGNPSDMCGSKNHISVYQSSLPVVGLSVSKTTTGTITAGYAVDFEISIQSGMGIYYQFTYDDDAARTPRNSSDMYKYTYHVPGTYSVKVFGTDLNNTIPESEAVTSVVVEDEVGNVDVTCPAKCATYEYCLCKVKTYRGSNMQLQDTADSTTYSPFNIADPIYDTVGYAMPTKGPYETNLNAAGIYVLEYAEFRMEGKVLGFNVYAESAGNINVLILSPVCATAEEYCPESNICAPTCLGYQTIDCTANVFCPSSKVCSTTCSTSSRYTTGGLKLTYSIKQTISVALNANYQYYQQVVDIPVSPGDILGYQYINAGKVYISSVPTEGEDYYFSTSTQFSANSQIGIIKGSMINAVMSAPSMTLLHYEFTAVGTFTITADINSTITPTAKTNSTSIDVIEGIDSLKLIASEYVAANEVVNFSIEPHTGSNVIYNWNFDDGTGEENTTSFPHSHTFTYGGVFNVTCESFNDLSRKSNFTEVIVEHRITSIDVTSITTATNIVTNFEFTMPAGSNFTCEWNFGDGSVVENKDDISTPPGVATTVTHTYTSDGIFTVNVTCYNHISSITKILTQYIQYPITNLNLVTIGADKSTAFTIEWTTTQGTSPSVTLLFDGTTYIKNAATNGFIETTNPVKSWHTTSIAGLLVGLYDLQLTVQNLVNAAQLNISFKVEAGMKDVVSTASATIVPTSVPVTFTLDMTEGSSVSVVYDWDDGTFTNFSLGDGVDWATRSPTLDSQVHTFTEGKIHNIVITAWNAGNSIHKTHILTAIQSVYNVEMHHENYYRFTPPAYPHFNFTTTGGDPNNADVFFDFGDTKEQKFGLKMDYNYIHQYRDLGKYHVTANLSNSISSSVLAADITIVEVLEGLNVQSTPPGAAAKGDPVVLHVILYRAPTGPDCLIDVGYAEGGLTDVIDHPRTGSGENGLDTFKTEIYNTLGTKTITTTVTTPLESKVNIYTIEVQDKVKPGFTVSVTPANDVEHPGPVQVHIVYTGAPLPTAASYSIDYGDGTFNNGLFTGSMSATSHTFAVDGKFEASITIYNLASSETTTFHLGSYIDIVNSVVATSYRPALPLDAAESDGLGTAGSFPRDRPVIFKMSHVTGTIVDYSISYTSTGGSNDVVTRKTNPFQIQFPGSDTYTVTITAKNPLFSDVATTTVIILDRVVNTTIVDATPRVGPGEAKIFNISFVIQGDLTCLLVNFGDGTQQTWADDPLYCNPPTFNPAPIGALHIGGLTGVTQISHIYNANGFYDVKAEARNSFSASEMIISAPVSSAKCTKPKVTIQDQSFQFYKAVPIAKSKDVRVLGKSDIHCATTLNNIKSWIVESIDSNTGLVIASVTISSLSTRNNAELFIPAKFLDYGLYRAKYSMEMKSDTFDGGRYVASTYTYIQVQKSDIVGIIERGGINEVRRDQKQTIILNPAKFSYDPDVDTPIGSQSFDSFTWTCEKANENATAAFCDDLLPDSNKSNSPLSIALSLSPSNADYKFCVVITKDVRSTKACLVIQLVDGDPPSIYLECTASSVCIQQQSGQLIPPSGRLGVKCECSDCNVADVINYNWIFYTNDYRWPWKSIENIDQYAVGINSKQLSIKKELFADFAPVTRFRAGCVATQQGKSSNGLAFMDFEINDSPSNGSCSISKTEGIVSVNKEFAIMCENWYDAQGIVSYQIIVRYKDDDVDREVIVLDKFEEPIELDLPLGAPYDDYKEKVMVQIRDSLGSVNEYEIAEVIVKPLSSAESRKMISDLQTNDFDMFDKVYAEGDTNAIATMASNLVALLNSDSKDAQTEYSGIGAANSQANSGFGPSDADRTGAFEKTIDNPALMREYEEKKDDRSQLKQQTVLALSSLTAASITSIKQISSVLAEFLHYPEEVTLKSATAALDKTLEMAKSMRDMSGISYEDRTSAYIYIAAIIGGSLDTIGFNGDHPSLTELNEATELPEFKVYDTNWENSKGAIEAENLEAAMSVHGKHTHKNHAGGESTQYIDKALQTMTILTQGFSQNSVPGEKLEFITNRMKGVVQNKDVKSMLGATIGIKGSNTIFKFPNDIDAIFSNGGKNENDSFVLQLMQTTSLPYQYSDHSSDLGSTSNGLVIDIFDDNGTRQTIKNLHTPFEFTIEKDRNAPVENFKVADPFITETDYLYYHTMNLTKKGNSLHVEFNIDDPTTKFLLLVRFGDFPDIEEKKFDFIGVIPNDLMKDPYRYTYFLDNKQINGFTGVVYIGVRQLDPSENGAAYKTAADLPAYEKGTGVPTAKYKIRTFSTGCYFFDDTINDWSTEGCWVGFKTDQYVTHCFSTHLTTFAGGWVVVPNTIDWNFVFANADFAKNPTLYITEIVIAVVYLFAVLWARREDKKDVERLGLTPLKDNDARDKYYYEVVVVTGMRRNAGTDSKVCFILSGEHDETDVRMFNDSKRKIFRRGAVDGFLLAVPRPLGTLNYARVWHDNSGKGKMASWYLKYVLVRDIQTNQRHLFICNKWFAVEEDDGQVDRVIPVAGKEQMTAFGHLFAEKSRKSLIDGHLWFSVVARPANSRFTRVQRVSCCLLLLFVSMLGNAMFYGQDMSSSTAYNIGPFALSPEQIFIGIAVNLIVFPINFLVITLFRKSRAKKMRPSRIDEALKRGGLSPTLNDSDLKPSMEGVWMSRTPTIIDDQKRAGTSASIKPEKSFSALSRMDNRPYHSLKDKKKKKKKKCELPWWGTICGWIVLWLSVGLSLAFVTFYGITFQDEKCKKWITSMLMSFFTSVFITQPVKVFLAAIFFSLVVKNPGEEEDDEIEDEEAHKISSDEEYLHFEDGYGATRPRKIGYKPPDPAELEKARIQRLNEIKMWEIIREIVFYSFFLWILMVISYRNRSPHGYFYKNSLVKTFIDNNDTKQWFSKVRNTAEFWNWSQSGLLNGIRANNYYNSDPPLLLRGFVNDKVSRIMGYATMRQLRVRKGLCETRGVMKNVINECNEFYSLSNEDEASYLPNWQTMNSTQNVNDTDLEWTYTTAEALNGYPYWGELEMYGGGGYVVQLRGSKDDIRNELLKLQDLKWIDQYTRSIFVEFTVYNAQVNLFAIGTLLAEFDSSGGVTTSSRFEPALLLPYMSSVMLFQIACEIIYVVFTAWFIIKAIKAIFKERIKYFLQFWNLIELGIIAVSLGAIIVYFYRLIVTNELTTIFARSHGNEYMKFQYAGYWNEIFTYMLGWLVFFGTLKFLKLLRFNKRMALIAATLSKGSKSLLHFMIIFTIVYMAFMQLFYLTFMNLSTAFQTFTKSMESGILMMMGKFDIYSMLMVEPILTQIFVFFFVLTITFILVNMFLSILNETFGAVREDMKRMNNDYEIVDFMVTRFKRWTGMGAAQSNTLQPEDLMAEGKTNPYSGHQDNVTHFPDRIDKLLNSISNIYMDEDGIAKRMTAKEQASNKSNMKGMLRGHSSQSGLTEIEN